MSNEFVARKGLSSLRSASFEETIRVSGSISSPAEAFLTASWASHSIFAATASYVNPVSMSGATTASTPNTIALRDANGGTGFNHLLFDTAGSVQPAQTGLIGWNPFEGTLDVHTDISGVVIQVGQETLVKARNSTGTTIPNGSAVYISGSVGNRPSMHLAIASTATSVNSLIGLVTADVLNNADTYITVAGKVNDLNTSGYIEGTDLYLSDTVVGGLTTVAPTGSSFPVKVGKVTRSHPTLGSVLVTVRQDFHTSAERLSLSELAAGRVTASLHGTSSYSVTSTYASSSANSVSASYLSGSEALVGSLTASYISASVVSASSLYTNIFSATVSTMSVDYLSVTQVINGTASLAVNALTASYVPASNVDVYNTSQDGTGVGGTLLVEHFLSATTALINTFATTVNGTSAAINIVTGSVGHPGVIRLTSGITATGRASAVSATTCILFGSGTYIFEADVQCQTLSTSAQRFTLYFGFGGVSGAGDMTNGAYFQYTDAASTFWQLKTANNSTRTTVTTSVTVNAGRWYKLRLVVTNDTSVDYYIDNVYVGSITTNIPTVTGRETGVISKIEKSVGTTARTALVDYIKVAYK